MADTNLRFTIKKGSILRIKDSNKDGTYFREVSQDTSPFDIAKELIFMHLINKDNPETVVRDLLGLLEEANEISGMEFDGKHAERKPKKERYMVRGTDGELKEVTGEQAVFLKDKIKVMTEMREHLGELKKEPNKNENNIKLLEAELLEIVREIGDTF